MGLLNLALGQLLGLFLPIAGLLVALYFYDRSRRSVLVSTLRFWPQRAAPAIRQRHKRIQHPLSLILQLAALLLLLLAIADPRPDTADSATRQRVLVLDTSATMALPDEAGSPLIETAKELALRYLQRVPHSDRVMLIEADGAPHVRVPFTSDRQRLREAVEAAEPGWTALDLQAAFELAEGTFRIALDAEGELTEDLAGLGETVYVGPGRVSGRAVRSGRLPSIRFVKTDGPRDELGVIALRAAARPAEPGKWEVDFTVRNYGEKEEAARIDFLFDDRPLGHRVLTIGPRADGKLRFTLRTDRPGRLTARTVGKDPYMPNNEAELLIPSIRRTPLEVVGGSHQTFEALLASGAHVRPTFVDSGEDLTEEAIHVWARGGDPGQSRRAIFLSPPGTPSPFEESHIIRDRSIVEWSASHPLAHGVRDPDLHLSQARVFRSSEGDEIVAGAPEGPVILARDTGEQRVVAFGFDLAGDSVRNRLAAPLLFANAIAWLDSGAFRSETVESRAPGSISIEAPGAVQEQVTVRSDRGGTVPWIMQGEKVRFFAGRRGTYRVSTADRDFTLFLNQSEVPAMSWEPADDVAHGLPSAITDGGRPWIAWPWLAALAAMILIFDWARFGRGRRLGAGSFEPTDASAEGIR